MGNVADPVASMPEYGGANPTGEGLRGAVMELNPKKVRAILDKGVNVNEPIDPQGHTVLDLFAAVHKQSIENCLATCAKGDPQTVTRVFCESQDKAFNVLNILKERGAVFAGRTGALRKGLA
eukprot:TRINITY_DN1014_c0_g1_i1.p2 TRINITY_DN1014_c0_g1~~TRINITY_DN1014_c0_g1_i1.p2  ORF type:complete len:122 (+),score=22.75 TRINITY_DN1014_c0_g1_i1:96-461(+)